MIKSSVLSRPHIYSNSPSFLLLCRIVVTLSLLSSYQIAHADEMKPATLSTADTSSVTTPYQNSKASIANVSSDIQPMNANEVFDYFSSTIDYEIPSDSTSSESIKSKTTENNTATESKHTPTPWTIPLQTIVDPNTGVAIDNTYQVAVPEKLSLYDAQRLLTQVSPKLASNKAAIESNRLRAQATESLNKPWVFLRANASHYNVETDLDLSDVKAELNASINEAAANGGGGLPIDPEILPTLPPFINAQIPDSYDVHIENTQVAAGIAALWPIYTAGRTKAITNLAEARTYESEADALIDSDELQTTLIERYFSTQLAIIAAYLRDDALQTIQETDHMAQRLLEEGFISNVERLEAKTALSQAQSEALKANNNAELAMTSLQRLMRTPYLIMPTTPLFISSKPLPPLEHFQKLAMQNQPALKKVDAKYMQAQSMSQFSNTKHKPNVSLYGYYGGSDKPNWIAGVSASWKLWGGLDSDSLHQSAMASMRQAELAKVDVSDNILLLVESNWQAVENARLQYLALNDNVSLTRELLRFKQLGLQEGVNTAIDVAEAQTKYLQARTEQTSAANDYVQALAALMQSVGTPEGFNDYMMAADIKLPVVF